MSKISTTELQNVEQLFKELFSSKNTSQDLNIYQNQTKRLSKISYSPAISVIMGAPIHNYIFYVFVSERGHGGQKEKCL